MILEYPSKDIDWIMEAPSEVILITFFQEKMLSSLGIKSVLFTDGNNFLNFLST